MSQFILTGPQLKTRSLTFGGFQPALPKIQEREVRDLREDIEAAFKKLETRVDYPTLLAAEGNYAGDTGTASVVLFGANLLAGRDKASVAVGGTNGVTFEAVTPGEGGNDYSIVFSDPGANNSPLAIAEISGVITISLATDGAGAITSTATEVADAVNADSVTIPLVQASATGVGSTIQTAVAETALSGGTGEGVAVYIGGMSVAVSEFTDTSVTIVDGEAIAAIAGFDESTGIMLCEVKSHTFKTAPIALLNAAVGGGGGGFASHDWASHASAVTDFGDGTSYPDLSVLDAGTAATNLATAASGAILRFESSNSADLVGRQLDETPVGDFTVIARMRATYAGTDMGTTGYAGAFLGYWDGADSGSANFYAVGSFRRTHDQEAGGVSTINGTGRPALTSLAATVQAASPRLGEVADFAFTRSGTTLTAWAATANGGFFQVDTWTISGANGLLGVLAAENDAGSTVTVEVLALAPDGVFARMPPFEDD